MQDNKIIQFLKSLCDFIDGYKFYAGLTFGFILWLGYVWDIWTLSQIKELMALDGLFLGWSFRSAMKKLEQ